MNDFLSSENISWLWRVGLAHGLILFLFLLGVTSFGFSFDETVRPYFFIICIYFWSIYRPTLMSPVYVFILGLLFDILLGLPLGLHALLFVVLQWGIRDQRLFFLGQPYMIVWIGFAFTCFTMMSAEWLFFSIISEGVHDFQKVIYGTVISTLIFPLITLLFNVIYRILPSVSQTHLM